MVSCSDAVGCCKIKTHTNEMFKTGVYALCLKQNETTTKLTCSLLFCFFFPSFVLFALPLWPLSKKKQEANQDESATAPWIIGARHQHACASHPQVHAPTCSHHAVCTQGHWAWDHLLRLWQHTAWHLFAAHDHSQQAGGTASHLCSQVGQVSTR